MLLGCREKDENIFYGFTGADAVVAFCQEIVAIAKKYVSTACDSWKKDLKKGTPQEDEALDRIEYSTNHFINMALSNSTDFISTVSLVSQNLLYTGSKSSFL